MSLHSFVIGPTAALGNNPVDNLVRVGDVASLTVHAIRGADFQFGRAAGFLDHFVDRRGAKILAGVSVLDHAFRGADVGVGNAQVAGLILFVARAGVIDVGEAIERKFSIAL